MLHVVVVSLLVLNVVVVDFDVLNVVVVLLLVDLEVLVDLDVLNVVVVDTLVSGLVILYQRSCLAKGIHFIFN